MERITDDPDVVSFYAIHGNGTIVPVDNTEREAVAIIDVNSLFEDVIYRWVDYQNYARNNPQPRTSRQQKVITEKWNSFRRSCGGRDGFKIPVASPFRLDCDVVNSVLSHHFGYMAVDSNGVVTSSRGQNDR